MVLRGKPMKLEYYEDIITEDGDPELFRPYPSCNNEYTCDMNCGKKYRMLIADGEYAFFGDTELEIYCKIISTFANESSPIVILYGKQI